MMEYMKQITIDAEKDNFKKLMELSYEMEKCSVVANQSNDWRRKERISLYYRGRILNLIKPYRQTARRIGKSTPYVNAWILWTECYFYCKHSKDLYGVCIGSAWPRFSAWKKMQNRFEFLAWINMVCRTMNFLTEKLTPNRQIWTIL